MADLEIILDIAFCSVGIVLLLLIVGALLALTGIFGKREKPSV